MSKITDIIDVLTREFAEGKYPPGSRFPSEYDLVRRFDVGRSTANKAVLSLVSSGLLVRGVRGAGTRVARPKHQLKGRILYLGSFNHILTLDRLSGAISVVQANGYGLEVSMPLEKNMEKYLTPINGSGEYIGIITHGYCNPIDALCPNLPVIYLDMPDPEYHPDKHYIATPNQEAAQKMMDAILAKGHREIVIYASPGYQFHDTYYRVKGFQERMRQAGIADVEKRLFPAMGCTEADAAENLRKILEYYPKTTLIATTSDDIVRTMLQALKAVGMPHPGPIALTGFGNIHDISAMHQIPTVEQNCFQFGVQACMSLIDLHEKRYDHLPNIQYVGYKMVNLDHIPPVNA